MSQVKIVKLAHFYNEGSRGNKGGAPSNDKIWGIAEIDNKLVNFWGRREGKLKFKTRFKNEMNKVLTKYNEKIGDRTDGGDIYTPINNMNMAATLCPTLLTTIASHFYSDMANGKLNTAH